MSAAQDRAGLVATLERRQANRRTVALGAWRELARGADRRKAKASAADRAFVAQWEKTFHSARAGN